MTHWLPPVVLWANLTGLIVSAWTLSHIGNDFGAALTLAVCMAFNLTCSVLALRAMM
jgi:hypothetical protein